MRTITLVVLLYAGVASAFTPEQAYFRDAAACLDPGAYYYERQHPASKLLVTVPPGRTWYLVNALGLKGPPHAGQETRFFHRSADVRHALPLAGPRQLQGTNARAWPAFVYLCKPETVYETDQRYWTDPRDLYYERMRYLQITPAKITSARVPRSINVSAGNTTYKAFVERSPGLKIIAIGLSREDAAWMTLEGPNNAPYRAINLDHEINNTHDDRRAMGTQIPFMTDVFNKIACRASSPSGAANSLSTGGYCTMHYIVLPDDW
jgi:hypothetical protein